MANSKRSPATSLSSNLPIGRDYVRTLRAVRGHSWWQPRMPIIPLLPFVGWKGLAPDNGNTTVKNYLRSQTTPPQPCGFTGGST